MGRFIPQQDILDPAMAVNDIGVVKVYYMSIRPRVTEFLTFAVFDVIYTVGIYTHKLLSSSEF